jgi:hypothetical protein
MALDIPALESTRILHGLLIELNVNDNSYYISNLYRPLSYLGNNYLALGHFIGMNELQDDLRSTNNAIQISLSGIPKDPGEAGLPGYNSFIDLILQTDIKGSRVKVRRVFFNPDTKEFLGVQTSLRFSGYISNYTLNNSTEYDNKSESNTLVIQCSNINAILDKTISGKRTNSVDQNTRPYEGHDSGLDRVVVISRTSFDFGKPYSPPA